MLNGIRVLVLAAACIAGAASADVAMLTQVSGDVALTAKDGSRPAVPFLKVNAGDKLALGKNGRLQMVYFGNGRQEVWKGEGQVEVGGLEGSSPTLKPETAQLPPLVITQLARTPAAGQQGRAGMVMLRSGASSDALAQLEKQFADLRSSAPADDTTPEVFLLSGLIDLKQYDRARAVLAELKGKQAAQPAFGAVVDHFTPIIEQAAAPK